MDKNEVIILSSDEESDFTVKNDIPFKQARQELNKNSSTVKPLDSFKKVTLNQNIIVINIHKNKGREPVEVVECIEESFRCNSLQIAVSTENSQNHSKPNIVNIEVDQSSSETKKFSTAGKSDKIITESAPGNIEPGTKNVNNEVLRDTPKSDIKSREGVQHKVSNVNVDSNQNLKFFTEFVEYCGSLEEVESDRAKLTKKLMKHYGEADCHYIKSEEFRSLIQKFRDKVTKNNLYLTAKEVTDELIYRKKIGVNTGNKTKKTCQRTKEDNRELESIINVDQNRKKGNKKQAKVIKKIIKKLDKLGLKIRELEEKEVDLSDEEDSAYLQLQRYRERFYQIYTKLCKFTSNVSDLDRIYNRRICFTESKYPEINKCIENWLNKTKRFPDFSDIVKLLETQSSSLNLPSNRDAIRAIAIEIFQKVGSMLQRKRKYDLWDSFCGYLGNEEDPASKDVLLDGILKKNFDIRIKKEQEIFQHYAELQEKQRLEPEEVPDEEANRSPLESGNEDEEEIQSIEERMSRRLDDVLKEDTEGKDDSVGKHDSKKATQDLEGEAAEQISKEESTQSKESKNNYKNCKSLKWRMENGSKAKTESLNSEESNVEREYETERGGNSENELTKELAEEAYSRKDGEDDSDLELIAVKSVESDITRGIYEKIKADTKVIFETPKRLISQFESPIPEKKVRLTFLEDDGFEVLEIDDENENPGKKINEVFDVHYCQIFSNTFLDDVDHSKKKWSKRKVFRDLTNINRLMELQGKRRKAPGLFSSLFHPGFCEFEKSSWKKKFRESFRSTGSRNQKCALNQEEKSGKTVNSDSRGDSDEKDVQNNSEGRGEEEGNNLFSGHGNGSEGDNNEDENKKNGRADIEQNETQREDDEEEEEDENNTESTEHSLPKEKTEEQLESETPSQSAEKSDETPSQSNERSGEKIIQEPIMSSETPREEKKEESKVDTENREPVLPVPEERENVKPESEDKTKDSVAKNEEAAEAEESKPEEEELEAASNTNEVTVVEKPNEDVDVIAVPNPPDRISEVENENKLMPPKEIPKCEIKRTNSCAKVVETHHRNRTCAIPKEYESVRTEKAKHFFPTNRPATSWKSRTVDSSPQNLRKRNAPSTSDEEIVKRFLLHSPSSISITPPRKLTLSKSPSQAALQALATLRNLKGISATIVRGKPKDSAIGGSYSRRSDQNSQTIPKRRRSDFPVISNAQTVTPKIVNVSGNVSGFDNSWPGMSNATCDSSPIRISNVWGSLPNNFMQSMMNETVMPGCSSQKSNPSPSNTVKKKSTKKNVEYVVLD